MSKYDGLWSYIHKQESKSLTLTFEQIKEISGVAVDHSFLTYKKELADYGWQVGKISMKQQMVEFNKIVI